MLRALLAQLPRQLFGRKNCSKRAHRQRRPVPLGVEMLEDRTTPAQLTVTSALDPAALTAGTLRYAVNQANTDAANGISDTIVFNTAQMGSTTITLYQGQLELRAGTGTTTIDGGGQVTVSGNNANRAFLVDGGAQAVLTGLAIQYGSAGAGWGGGILNYGALTVNNDRLIGNTAQYGGALFNQATLVVSNSVIWGNSAGYGGGLYNQSNATLSNSAVSENAVVDDGAGIGNTATLALSNCTLSGNISPRYGGAVFNETGTLTVSGSTLENNSAEYGGGIFNQFATLILGNSVMSGNSADWGGGLYTEANATLTNATVSNNTAHADGGGIGNTATLTLNDCTLSGNGAARYGGAVFNETGTLTVSGGLFQGNTSTSQGGDIGGAICNNSVLYLSGVTLVVSQPAAGQAYSPVNNSLFGANGPSYLDVEQGAAGDCWLMASLAEVAARAPSDIRNMFTYDGTTVENGSVVGVYTVRFYNNSGGAEYVTVDTELPAGGSYYDHITADGALWVALAEKAYVEANAAGFVTTGSVGSDSYNALNNGDPAWALRAITGKSVSDFSINPSNIAAAWNTGQLIVLGTASPGSPYIVPDHAYAVVSYNASNSQPFQMYNPWGTNSSGWALGTYNGHQVYGLFTANAAFLSQNFTEQSVGVGAEDGTDSTFRTVSPLPGRGNVQLTATAPVAAEAAFQQSGFALKGNDSSAGTLTDGHVASTVRGAGVQELEWSSGDSRWAALDNPELADNFLGLSGFLAEPGKQRV
jgi:hypothetical protein